MALLPSWIHFPKVHMQKVHFIYPIFFKMMWPYKCFICYEKGDNKENDTAVFPSILRSLLDLSLYLIS